MHATHPHPTPKHASHAWIAFHTTHASQACMPRAHATHARIPCKPRLRTHAWCSSLSLTLGPLQPSSARRTLCMARSRTHARTRARAHTHTHTHAQTRIHTCTHRNTDKTNVRARAHTHTHTRAHTLTPTHAREKLIVQDLFYLATAQWIRLS